MTGQIPATAHFVWLGRDLPWVYGLALRSAAGRGGFERVVLHCTDDVSGSDGFTLARDDERVESRRLDPRSALWWVSPRGGDLVELYSRLKQPAAKSNIWRCDNSRASEGAFANHWAKSPSGSRGGCFCEGESKGGGVPSWPLGSTAQGTGVAGVSKGRCVVA